MIKVVSTLSSFVIDFVMKKSESFALKQFPWEEGEVCSSYTIKQAYFDDHVVDKEAIDANSNIETSTGHRRNISNLCNWPKFTLC